LKREYKNDFVAVTKLEEMGEKSEGLKIVKELMAKFKLTS